jgi:hypothetical protein
MLHWWNKQTFQEHIKIHKYNLTQALLEKSKLAQYAYEKDHKICRKEAKVLQIERNTAYRKYKESAHMSLIDHLISQPSLDIFSIWTAIIVAEVKNYNSVQCRVSGKIVFFYVGTIQRIYFTTDVI